MLLQVAEPLALEAAAHLLQQRRAAPPEAEHVTLVQPAVAGLARVRLAQDAADELRQRRLGAGAGQNRQHVGERAVPSLLQRLLGDDEADRTVARQQAAGVVHLLQVVAGAGLHGDVLQVDVGMLQQVLAGVVGVHDAGLALVTAGALHLDQADRADAHAAGGGVAPGALLQLGAVLHRGQQRVLPARPGAVADVQVELDHLLGVEVAARHLDQHVGLRRRRGGELHDQAGIEPLQRRAGVAAVRLVPLVQHDQRTQQAQGVAERGFDLPAPEAFGLVEDVEIGDAFEQGAVGGHFLVAGEEAVEPAAVAEHAQLLPGLTVGRRQHQQQDAQAVGHVPGAEEAALLQDAGAAGGGQVELLPVGMGAVLERGEGLAVDLRGRHHPQHQPGLPVAERVVHQVDHAHRQQRLAAAGGDLEAERGQRFTGAGGAGGVGPRRRAPLPGAARPVEAELGVGSAGAGVGVARLGQRFEQAAHLRQDPPLVVLEDHRAGRGTPAVRRSAVR